MTAVLLNTITRVEATGITQAIASGHPSLFVVKMSNSLFSSVLLRHKLAHRTLFFLFSHIPLSLFCLVPAYDKYMYYASNRCGIYTRNEVILVVTFVLRRQSLPLRRISD